MMLAWAKHMVVFHQYLLTCCWLIPHPGQSSEHCQGGALLEVWQWGQSAHMSHRTVLALKQGHKQVPGSLSGLPTFLPFPICVSIFPVRVALLISLILFSIFGMARWYYPRFNASCVLQITGLLWIEWQEILFSPNHGQNHELSFI